MHRALDVRLPAVYDAVAARRPREVLDVGPAGGEFARRLSELAPVTAIDARDHGWAPHPGVTWRVQRLDARAIAALGRFDAVVALSVLHHVRDWRGALRALRQVARETLLVEVPHPDERLTKPAARRELAALHQAVMAVACEELVSSPATRQPEEYERAIVRVPPLLAGRAVNGGGIHGRTQREHGDAFEHALGYRPFPGSLNVRVGHGVDLPGPAVEVDTGVKVFRAWPARVVGVDAPAHLLAYYREPPRGQRDVEVLAPVRLRDHLAPDQPVELEVLT